MESKKNNATNSIDVVQEIVNDLQHYLERELTYNEYSIAILTIDILRTRIIEEY